jgi:hypothetical protein
MSDVVIKGNASGTGSVTIESPNTNSDYTLTLPQATTTVVGTDATQTLTNKSIVATQLTGTIATARLPAGSVLQVVQGTSSTQYTTTSGSYQDTNVQATITPTSATSKILILGSLFVGADLGGDDAEIFLRLNRSGTTVITWGSNYWVGVGATRIGGQLMLCGNYLDNPTTTSAITYKIQFSAGAGATAYVNGGGTRTSTITLMEIAA